MEAESAFNHAVAQTGALSDDSIRLIMGHKKEIIRNSGALEYIEPEEGLDDVGGLDRLKDWLSDRRQAYSPEAIERGLPQPKGVLLIGVPGCGKSLTAKAVSSAWNFPLIRFDIGAVYQGVVGSSESNIRNALKVAEAASPCILWIDEIEKGMAGSGGSGDLDSGVALRVFGTILTWLNEVKKPVFVVATANNIANIPPELKRKGRFDEIFFIDLPDEPTRAEIFRIHISRSEPDALANIDLDKLSGLTDKWTGAEIEQAIKDSRFRAFADGNRPVSEGDIIESIRRCTPMAEGMSKVIEHMRAEADIIGQRASSRIRGKSGGGNVYTKSKSGGS
jgi:SpoVK/Ycf46/Vps4 family AAA+-type ATPase